MAVLVAAWQLRRNTQQATTDFEDDLAREYRELARGIPVDAHLGGKLTDDEFSGDVARRDLTEDLALRLGLAVRALAPMRNRAYMRGVAEGIDAMAREEAAYWLGMAMHRRRPRRVLAALRCLLVE